MNGFSAADMSTAAANGFRDGLAAQPAAAQEEGTVEIIGRTYLLRDVTAALAKAGYAHAPVAAAPAVDVATLRALADRWANDRSYTGSPVDDIRALIEQPTVSTPASSADSVVLTNPYTGQPRDYRDVESDPAGTLIVEPGKPLEAASTPAAPGIDLEQFRALVYLGMTYGQGSSYRLAAEKLRDLIDDSPKGGSEPVVILTIGEAGEEGTQAYFLDRIRDTEAFGKLPPGTYQLAVCSVQATSAEVGE